jgi:hypothetical protein
VAQVTFPGQCWSDFSHKRWHKQSLSCIFSLVSEKRGFSMRTSFIAGTVGLFAVASAAHGQAGNTFVDAQSNIFGYGLTAPAPGGGGGGVVAISLALNAGTGRTATFFARGTSGWAGSPVNGPDGGSFSGSTNIPSVGPISGFNAPLSGHLLGLFIEAGDISALSAPGAASYPDLASFGQTNYSPLLRQVFFIGDGLTGTNSGTTQTFDVPDGAGFLVFGIADAFGFNAAAGYYADNVGGFDVDYAVVPAPGVVSIAGLSLAIAGRRRRR